MLRIPDTSFHMFLVELLRLQHSKFQGHFLPLSLTTISQPIGFNYCITPKDILNYKNNITKIKT